MTSLPEPNAPLLTRQSAAKVLAISARKLDQLVADGKLRRIKIGASVRFLLSDLQAFIEAARAESAYK